MDQDLTGLLHDWRAGDEVSRDRLLAQVYDTLRGMAAARLRRGRGDQTLQPTAVVNEALLRLLGTDTDWEDRAHFFALAALKMRAVLVDHARARAAEKRGGDVAMLTLSHADREAGDRAEYDVLALHQALERLAVRDERAARGLEMAYFGGMERREIACVLGISVPTVERDLRFARAWLNRQLA
ncbi:sigma-70 family RNA polymerase sigma factor [Luteimonas sp. SJ-92]|uniref:Sigma-70 family RNA polymerase sigma factor n=1 Tax=Luteimonas salinisoli TaxID=2752307 RepID=A0A853J9H6_9GAMM|nr:ECF-type sigma factor [Luteimonas salinisoli]NZA25339.1 sigma-70 family RNA polymerase sigma factor [Luteimonas salinisoli]